ncbi:aminoacyl-tRNA deacylase [Sinorhizobium medicae]|uniref:Aminoacyl-tRNA deacylase n=2 Tax=Sinorhizobium medicae TaxID=110321 RepID=A0A508WSD0_9HYPH|nr:aminoacyl-tRNA deacylase [Sinorhizobium medicae]ABR58949.1 YbaK/prolyl-tRNA synthetase associated region [Sinorhizobium medicae WSM419]MBO1940645.1 aminoacyl-tRNA deacylase [Sinorhizobium medicae]MBO1963866.1 aminoacyl-tRNA deacylase [Sinorhizobium medicae]MDX0407156.1 aminoacyl-tRNA deacylase [Sinorhizobium medicae]MDX0419183.1 aminoacyl-tRNA deacylase [Sinorhizobium medicae]
MTIARKLQDYIDSEGIDYDTLAHHRTATTSQTAEAAHVPGNRLAKSVVVHHETGYVLAVVPASHRVELSTLQEVMNRRLGLASEEEVSELFSDCETGAVPPIGSAYGVAVILDESLDRASDVYFEGGDHRTLVHMSGPNFRNLTKDAQVARFSHPS